MSSAIGIVARRRDWHRAATLLILSLIHHPLWAVDRDATVIWKEGSAYSDHFIYNGFAYKTIRVFDERDPSLSLSVAVSSSRDDCPGKRGKCLSALIIVKNEGTVRFDVQPERFECHCNNDKHRVFSQYPVPNYLKRGAPPGALLTANTATPGKTVQGIVYFNGNCPDYVIAIPIDLSEGGKLLFEFPYALR